MTKEKNDQLSYKKPTEKAVTAVRIANTNIPVNKKIHISLTYIFGIGLMTSKKICALANVDPELHTYKLTKDQIVSIVSQCEKFKLNEELKKDIISNVQKLVAIKCRKGIRLSSGLPVRGQNTHSNAKNSKKCKIINQSYKA